MISAVIITKNEEKNIVDCLESLMWVDEIIVVDDNSEDRTCEIAKTFNVKVFKKSLEKSFARQRNFGLEKAKGEWVLFIDADERISNDLQREIVDKIHKKNDITGYLLKRKDIIFGKELKYGETARSKFLRLAMKDKGLWAGDVHEKWLVSGKTETLDNSLVHYPHQTISDFLEEINFYTNLRAAELYRKKIKVMWWEIILFPMGKFVANYFFKMGYKDGIPGLLMAIFMSLHSFLVRAKLYLLWEKE